MPLIVAASRRIVQLLAVVACLSAGSAQLAPGARADAPASRTVHSAAELNDVLSSGVPGRVVIPRGADWDMRGRDGKPLHDIPVRSGVQIVGERGTLGSRPQLFTDDLSEKFALFEVTGADVRIEGIHFRGPKPAASHAKRVNYIDAIKVVEDAEQRLGRRVVIADNEFDQWSHGGVALVGGHPAVVVADWISAWKRLYRTDAELVRVERNYMHHNVMDGGGYGVVVSGGAYGTVEGNVFDYNRHSVAADGKAYSGYVARFNYVLQGGVKQGSYYNQHFDVHGTANDGYGGAAGDYYRIANNTIRGDQGYYLVKTRPAFMLRGTPKLGAFFNDNIVAHDDLDSAVALKPGSGIGEDQKKFNFHARGNHFDTDFSKEIASGDFDGDGRTDVFVANGTGWFFSRGGVRPWELLHISDKRTANLGFADIDNDGVTDVLYRDGAGNVGYLKSGRAALAPLTTSPVAMKDLRFGDFDGDRRTDIFYTRNGQWRVWYGRTHAWAPAQTSAATISDLLFGQFDDVAGTDVVAVRNGAWSFSSAATQPWARLNAKLTADFASAVAADFDGNGKTDIGIGSGKKWRYSPDGRAPLATLRNGQDWGPVKGPQIGTFDPGTRAMTVLMIGERLWIWRGLGSGGDFAVRSTQNMR